MCLTAWWKGTAISCKCPGVWDVIGRNVSIYICTCIHIHTYMYLISNSSVFAFVLLSQTLSFHEATQSLCSLQTLAEVRDVHCCFYLLKVREGGQREKKLKQYRNAAFSLISQQENVTPSGKCCRQVLQAGAAVTRVRKRAAGANTGKSLLLC